MYFSSLPFVLHVHQSEPHPFGDHNNSEAAPPYAILSLVLPLKSKYSPQDHVLIHPQFVFSSQFERTSFAPIQKKKTGKITISYILIFKLLGRRQEDERF
jgi:hypothetical protein